MSSYWRPLRPIRWASLRDWAETRLQFNAAFPLRLYAHAVRRGVPRRRIRFLEVCSEAHDPAPINHRLRGKIIRSRREIQFLIRAARGHQWLERLRKSKNVIKLENFSDCANVRQIFEQFSRAEIRIGREATVTLQ